MSKKKETPVEAAPVSQPPVTEAAPEVAAEVAVSEPASAPVPAALLEQLDEINKLYENVHKQIEEFKSGQAYLPGDIPVTLHGLGGPGFEIGQRRLNWIDEKHLDTRLAFRWCNKKPEIIGGHVGKGRWPVQMEDFLSMVKARAGVNAANVYKLRFFKSAEGYVAIGDLILMATTKEINENLKARVSHKTRNQEGAAKGNLYDQCERLGTEPIENEISGPKLQRIVQMLEQELGPNVRRVFLGG